ncbi:23 kDa integral membrane protein-like isoform X2 [Oncorhynchus mykiss]|uniref:23 kDa integral membrane protein-like isoform X2 n=1 Tax=Oncorhynchus mykiss TaxID=8022 RepID=UPI000B4F394B|nr:23 kDa integral membrane protein-like isoform X2 [Oncorhynchus mykiss]
MGNGRTYTRGLCITFNVLLLVSGVFLFVVGVSYSFQHPPEFDHRSTLHEMYVLNVFGPMTVLFSILGGYAAYRDKRILLILYVVFMTCEFIAIVIIAVPMLRAQPKMEEILDRRFHSVTPLHDTEPQVQRELNKLQASDQCCGLRGHSDWGCHIPLSCYCPPLPPDNSLDSLCETVNLGLQNTMPCGPILKRHMNFLIQIMIGFISTFATIMIAAIVMSLVVLALQIRSTEPPLNDSLDRVKYQLSPLAVT